MCKDDDPGAFPVKTQDEDGQEITFYLHKGNLSELGQDTSIYVEVEHEIKYPYSAFDFWRDLEPFPGMNFPDPKTFYYCQAAVVFSPKMNLI